MAFISDDLSKNRKKIINYVHKVTLINSNHLIDTLIRVTTFFRGRLKQFNVLKKESKTFEFLLGHFALS